MPLACGCRTMNERIAVASPCINVCVLDDRDLCVGCFRHANEIALWSGLSRDQKIEVLVRVAERRERKLQGTRDTS